MKIVSPMGIVMAVLLTALVVGCSSGPGQAPDDDMPSEEMEPPATHSTEVSGTFAAVPDAIPVTGTITATITGVSQNGTPVTDPAALAGVLAEFGLSGNMATFSYTLVPGATSTTITLSGVLLMRLAGGDVMATREDAPDPTADPTAALDGMWTGSTTDPQTMATISLNVNISFPNFTLTVVAPAAPATS